MTFDEIYTFTDPLIDPVITPVAVDSDPINCDGSKEVNFRYTPGATDVRGYTVRVACDAPLTFDKTDVSFYPVPDVADFQAYVTEVTAGSVYDVDYVILGGITLLSAEQNLFKITFDGADTGTGTVGIVSVSLRDNNNIPITSVVSSGTAGIDVDCDAPTGTFVINNDDTYTTSAGVTLYNSVTGATEMRFSNDGSSWDDWVTYAATHVWTLTAGDGTKTVYGEFKDAAGNTLADDDDIILDTTFPTGSFVINNDDTYTGSVNVTLNNSVTGATEMRFSNDGSAWDDWVTYAATHVWTLTAGDGTKTVYGEFRDCANNTLADDDAIILDTAFPTGSFVINNDDTYTNTVNVTLNNSVTGATEMRFSNDGSAWDDWVTYAATHVWTLTAGDGTKTVYGEFRDAVGPALTDNDDIDLDTAAPGVASDIAAQRGHNKITVTWTNPDDGEAVAEVWRHMWYWDDPDDDPDMGNTSAYPEYDDVHDYTPTRPTSRAVAVTDPLWVLAVSTAVPAPPFVDDPLDRGIYYYEVFLQDEAGNWSLPAADNAHNLSYLLGDVTGDDGIVDAADITVLGAAYGKSEQDPPPVPYYYNNECDVGPTDDWSGAGIPTTDNYIDFEDLMIFALNWDVTVTKTQPTEGSLIARLSWVKVDDTTWSLVLVEPCANLKGVNLRAKLPQDGVLSLTAGDLLKQQDSSYFLQNIPSNGLDAGMALLGGGACITGQGELIRVNLAGELDLDDILIVARNSANKDLEYSLEETTVGADTPTRYMVSANYPNPFNPSTKIDFALPELQHVKLMIFGIDGRRIATLKNEPMSAGHYTVTWTGRDDQGELVASGIYFYRIQAGDFSRIQKMTLLK